MQKKFSERDRNKSERWGRESFDDEQGDAAEYFEDLLDVDDVANEQGEGNKNSEDKDIDRQERDTEDDSGSETETASDTDTNNIEGTGKSLVNVNQSYAKQLADIRAAKEDDRDSEPASNADAASDSDSDVEDVDAESDSVSDIEATLRMTLKVEA